MARRVTTVRQLELLVEYMESHKDLALGRVNSKEARALASRLWSECATLCNAEGTFRNPKEWSRYWNDFKGRVKVKLRAIHRCMSGTGGGPSTETALTPMEDRVAAILGRDVVAPLTGVQQNPFQFQYSPTEALPTENSPNLFTATGNSETEYHDDVHIEESAPAVEQTVRAVTPQSESPELIRGTNARTSQRSERRTTRHAPRSSLLTQQVEDSLNISRDLFAKLEEAKIAAQEKLIAVEKEKAEAMHEIALAINRLADTISSYNPGSSTQARRYNQAKRRRIASSSDSDNE